jgi:hypothetical protein
MEVKLENLTAAVKRQTEAALLAQAELTKAIERHTRLLKIAMEDTSDVSVRAW